MEEYIYSIVSSKEKQRKVGFIILGLLIFSLMMIPTRMVLAKMLPGKSANTYSIYVDTATNSTIEQTKEVVECVVNELKGEKEIKNMEMFLGQGAPLDYAGLVKGSSFKSLKNQAEIVINMSDKHERDEASYMMVHRLRPLIQKKCENIYKGTTVKFVEMPSGPPTFATIVVNIFGKDSLLLRETSKIVSESLRETEGLVDIDVMQDDVYEKYEIVPNVEKIISSNLSVEQVSNILYMAFKGNVVATKNSTLQQDQIPIFVRLDDETRELESSSLNELELKLSRLKLVNKVGIMVPLKEVVDITPTIADPTIFKKNMKEMVSVTAECDLVSQVYPLMDAREIMIEKLSKDFEIERLTGMSTYMFDLALVHKQSGEKVLIRWDGEMKVSLDTFRDLGGAFISALVLMFLLMVVYYKSFALSGIVLIGSFLSIIGVIFGHFITDMITLIFADIHFYLTATSLIGFISLMGISARSSLLLIDFTMSLIESGVDKNRAIAISTATRAKPILLTAVAIILGSLLLATDPIFGGLGIALIFGSIASTLVSIFYIPVLMAKASAICPINKKIEECETGSGVDSSTLNIEEIAPEVHHNN
ncbi:MAG: efflux RND transporter permease subunit [Sulfurimonas sp.]|jgi:multidrug efflux pump subunit AcrB|nr:efflux RND transporter permease subunit [Sulfurimonas sp.]MBU1216523.1 efflux RND transporter permease subunit [bacterium]MBU1433532.1 efflux RND transporter permease subunit [bacterium]MBU1503286.1 efflux RND transporter permease subunit [bacterium]MBU3938385.1 efflux RND transporter permease subunit [bacterium]